MGHSDVRVYSGLLSQYSNRPTARIDVLAVIPNGRRDHLLQNCGGSVTIVYNTALTYSISDSNSNSPADIAQIPFTAGADQQEYVQYLMIYGSGDLSCINDISPSRSVLPRKTRKLKRVSKPTRRPSGQGEQEEEDEGRRQRITNLHSTAHS